MIAYLYMRMSTLWFTLHLFLVSIVILLLDLVFFPDSGFYSECVVKKKKFWSFFFIYIFFIYEWMTFCLIHIIHICVFVSIEWMNTILWIGNKTFDIHKQQKPNLNLVYILLGKIDKMMMMLNQVNWSIYTHWAHTQTHTHRNKLNFESQLICFRFRYSFKYFSIVTYYDL